MKSAHSPPERQIQFAHFLGLLGCLYLGTTRKRIIPYSLTMMFSQMPHSFKCEVLARSGSEHALFLNRDVNWYTWNIDAKVTWLDKHKGNVRKMTLKRRDPAMVPVIRRCIERKIRGYMDQNDLDVALANAVDYQNYEAAQVLLEQGATSAACANHPLFNAIDMSDVRMCEILLTRPEAMRYFTDMDGVRHEKSIDVLARGGLLDMFMFTCDDETSVFNTKMEKYKQICDALIDKGGVKVATLMRCATRNRNPAMRDWLANRVST